MKDDTNVLFQQIGELLSAVRGLYNTMDIRQAQAEQLYNLLRSDLTIARHDQREFEEKFDRMFWVAQHDIESLRLRSADGDRSVQMLVESVNALKRPIADIAAVKARAAGLLFAVGAIGSAALWLADPIYHWFVEAILLRR